MSDFSPAAVIVHPSGTNNQGYEAAFPLWVTGSTSSPVVFPAIQRITGSVTVDQGSSGSVPNAWPVLIASRSSVAVITNTTAVSTAQALATRNIPQGTQTVAGSGNFNVVGPGAAGAATSGNPVRVGASDGTTTRNILSDAQGRLIIVGPYITGSLFTGSAISPVIMGGVDPQNRVRVLDTNESGALLIAVSSSLPVTLSGTQTITGTVNISNFPASQTVNGTVTAVITGTINTNILNQVTVTTTGSLPVSFSGVQTITGTVQTSVTNFPATQAVTGTVSITGQPLTVQGSVTSVITGTVSTNVLNQVTVTTTGSLPVIFSGIQTITGSVGIENIVSITGSVLVSSTGSLPVLAKQSQTVATSSIAASNSVSQVLLSASNNRLFAAVYNDSSARLYLLLGSPASTTSFTIRMDGQSYFEVPIQYTGVVTGIWSSNAGDARMTEVRQ